MAQRRYTPKPGLTGLWFPIALVFLLLLAVPGAVLLALNLLGKQGAVNAWLQETLGISYHIPLPWWAGLLLLLVPLLIVLLYFLKLKRKPLEVPSTFLWRKSVKDLHVNSLFQWLRKNVLLLLQLVTILFLIYSVLAFQVHGQGGSGKHYILMIDNSASMAVADVLPSRLEAAKQEAIREIDAHGENDFGMVIVFNSRASILQPYTSDRTLLRKAVERIEQTQRPTRIDEALALADSLANPLKSTDDEAVRPAGEDPAKARNYVAIEGIAAEVHLYSDGRFGDGGSFAAGNLELNYHRIGKPGLADNVGIVTLNAVRDDQSAGKVQVFARVLNFRKEPVQTRARLEVRVAGLDDFQIHDQILDIKGLTTAAADADKPISDTDTPGEGVVTFDLKDLDDAVTVLLHIKLLDVKDQFPLDDEAWLVLGVVRKARVLIVTDGNEILHDFFDLEATAKVAAIQYLKPTEIKDEAKYLQPARSGAFDLVLFDRCAPETPEALPLSNTFFIDAVPPPFKRTEMPPLKDAVIRNPASNHPLMRHLTGLDDIAISQAFRFDLKDPRVPPKVPRLLEADRETAVLFALPRRAFTDLVMTFPLVNAKGEWTTNWNLKLSFPVFLRNVLYTLGNVSDAAAEENVPPGQVKSLRPDVAVTQLEVTSPVGVKETLSRNPAGDFSYKNTERVGVYRAAWAGQDERSFAVNLLDAEESNLRPRDEIKIGAQSVAAGPSRGHTRETWKWSALAALALLVLEWVFYHRRIFY
jgi:hypothetical protein